ncbi:ankyrin repeat domain-containing protein [Chamaesiphon sp. VAR_48_metabat_135_sub]|uniref:ankyrin repeat domain-containing protein n=1 Tax=Chamaesiphon sp. VAR_48_metabat_135_sub TaxID=2964699 RepID=UPI00286A9D74|nr:ankyrin repeat domain-containing protein [Chamaesiphon sp. VAR_48_metabat_135_sub]
MSVDPKTQSLFDAIAAVSYDRVKLAIDSGAAINSANHRGQTPLALACRQGNLEIVDLLVAAGAQMKVQQSPASGLPIAVNVDASSISVAEENLVEAKLAESLDRQVPFENLIDLINQPTGSKATEIEKFMPIVSEASFSRAETTEPDRFDTSNQSVTMNKDMSGGRANWQDMESNAEDTYTFDLDKVFNDNADLGKSLPTFKQTEMFVDSEITMTSFQHQSNQVEFEAGETYAFDLSPDLEKLTADADREPDRLSVPMGSWGDTETCILEDFSSLVSTPAVARVAALPELRSQQIVDMDTMFEMDEDSLSLNNTWEEGETYAIDLDDLNLYKQMLGKDVTAESIEIAGGVSIATEVTPSIEDRHLLADIDSSLFPVIAGDDEPDYDPDTQTSTDIFGQVAIEQDDEIDLTGGYEENSTNTSLMAAVIDGDLDLAQQAIEVGASLDRYDWNLGYSPLGMSIDRGHADLVRCLLAAGANPHCGNIGTTALGLAAERGEVEIIQMLLPRGLNVNEPVGSDGWTALLSAIKNGHRSVVQLLVTAGANVNVWSRGETPILLAAKCEEREIYNYLYPLVNTIIRLCADRDGEHLLQATRKRRIREQNRPVEKFIEMATMGNIDEINRAIEIGVEIDEIGAKGHTALMAAAYYGHRSIVNTLLAAGANPNLLSDDDGLGLGMTALMLTAGSFFASNRQQVMKLLIAGGADINQRGAGGKTAIFHAALAGSGYADCVETSIAAGADLDLRDDRGHTVLTAVAAAENYQMLNLLIQAGASTVGLESIQLIQAATAGNIEQVQSLLTTKVNLDLDRGAAIGNASAAGHTKIVELLICAGANVNLRDKLGFAPISSAAYAGYGEIVQLLIAAGADIQAPAIGPQRYSALEYAQMGLYQFDAGASGHEKRRDRGDNLQHAQIIRQLERLSK